MKSIITKALVATGIFVLGTLSQASAETFQPISYHGTDSLGLAIVEYKGEVYHLTTGDSLAGAKYVSNEVNQIELTITVKGNTWNVFVPYTEGK